MISNSLEETKEFAKEFLEKIEPSSNKATVIGLKGNLGSGKTTFTQFVAEILGVLDVVNSPTFVIQKIYKIDFKGFENLIHIDAYRLDKGEELLKIGWEDVYNNPKNLILIEWPERVKEILSKEAKFIEFEFVDENAREIVSEDTLST